MVDRKRFAMFIGHGGQGQLQNSRSGESVTVMERLPVCCYR
ncbi:MAG: hypothetical protein Q4C60_01250 [Eubacteriales bacterium]|nr:hypothetical protein [Eubacteriales bacterium]